MNPSEMTTDIRSRELELERLTNQIKTVNEQMVEILEDTNEYDDVINLSEQLKVAKEKLRLRMQQHPDYMNLTEKKAELADTKKAVKHILSEKLVAYFGQTKERQIEVGPGGDARTIVLEGKLGKQQKYQESLFSPLDGLQDMAAKHDLQIEMDIEAGDNSIVIDKDGIMTKKGKK